MKKLLFPLFLSLSLLFTGCNSIYENHHRTTKVIINLPKITTSSSRKIYDSDIELSSDNNIEFTITLTSGSSEFNLTAKKGESIVFSNIPVGPCTITGLVSAPGLPDFAFGQIRKTIKLGTNNIDLTLSRNLLDNIEDIKVLKDISKTTYELGEPIDDNGAIYAIVLSNGYSFEYNKNELYSLGIGAEVRFKKCDEDEYNNNNKIVPDTNPEFFPSNNADRYYFIIDYHFSSKTKDDIDFNKYSYATINAKTPVITKQPESMQLPTTKAFSFEIEVETPSSGTTSYTWSTGSGQGALSGYTTISYEDDRTNKIKGSISNLGYASGFGNSMCYKTYYCTVTYSDNEGGLNGNSTSQAVSDKALLEIWQTNSGAANQKYILTGTSVKLADENYYFISTNENDVPPASAFRIHKYFKTADSSSSLATENITYPDYTNFNIRVSRKEGVDPNSFGYIPYIVTYDYKYQEMTQTNTGGVYNATAGDIKTVQDVQEEILVPTKLAKIPDYNFSLTQMANLNQQHGIDDQALERFYNFEDEKFYVKNKKDEYKEANYSGMKELHTNTVSAGIYQYSSSTTDPEYNTSCFEPSFKVYKEINGIRNAGIAINNSDIKYNIYNNLPYVIYELTDQDFNVIESGSTLRIFIECTLSVKEEYKNYFQNAQPVSITTDTVTFSKYIP